MINKTNIPVLLDNNIRQETLDNAIRSTIEFTCSHKNEAKQLFESGLKDKEVYDLKFIISCFDFVMSIKNARAQVNIDVSKLAHKVIRSKNENNTVDINIRTLHSSVKIILVHLWHEKLILLPLEFRTGTTFSYKSATSSALMNKLLTPVALFISQHPKGSNSLLGHEYLSKWNTDELSKSGWRLFLSTSFHTFSDFNIDEFSELSEIMFKISPHYREISGYRNTGISPILKALYVEYLENHSEDIKITKKDILSFDNWRKQSTFSYSSFRTFRNFLSDEIKAINRKNLNERKKNTAQKKSLLRRFDNESSNKINIDFTVSSVQKDLELIISLNDHASAIQYFKRCQYLNNSFKRDKIVYPGCDFLPVIDGTNIWIKTIRSYITYRENRGLTIESSVSNANILIDYLFFYLRFWKNLNNHIDFNPPYTPAEFNRALHFQYRVVGEFSDAGQSIDVNQRPLTLLEILEVSGRRSKGYSINSFIEFMDQLFAYIIADKTAYPEIADKFISSPVHQKIDKTHVHRHRESVKEDIHEALFNILWLYFEALENFGIEWLNNTISDPLSFQDDLMNEMPEFFHAWELGMEIPTFSYKGSIFEIDPIPNVFFPNHRTIKIKDGKLDQNGKPEIRLVPVLTSLRLTYSIVGMAIRGQSVQWLDREQFDLSNLNNPTEDDYYLINVSTDKVKKEPWNTLCHKKIRDVLLREQSWQLYTAERNSKTLIMYENRENPPQGSILPLFRSSGKNPVDDKFYYRTWELAWMSLHSIISSNKDKIVHDKEIILRGITGCLTPIPAYPKGYEDINGMHIVTFPNTEETTEETDIENKKPYHQRHPNSNLHKRKYSKPSIVGPFCEVKYKKRYVPHSSRVSHVTILVDHGIPPDLIQEITGQTIPLVRYYTKNKQKRLIKALKQTSILDTSEPVHLHPSSPSSAMNQNLSINVDEAILQHKFAIFDLRDPSLRGGTDALATLKAYGVDKCDVDDHRLCVAGGKCPTDALESIKEPNRCALCHYSLYGIDHQPGILARIEALRGECTAASKIIKTHNLNESHQSKKLVKTVSYKRSLDLLELSVYEKILTYLEQATKVRADDDYHFFYTQDPDVISQQLELRSQNGGLDEFLYLRFSQCREYGHLAIDNTLVKHANLLARRLSVKLDKDDTTIEDIPDTYTLIDLLWNQIVTIANIEGKSIRQIHSELLSLPGLQKKGTVNLLVNRC